MFVAVKNARIPRVLILLPVCAMVVRLSESQFSRGKDDSKTVTQDRFGSVRREGDSQYALESQ